MYYNPDVEKHLDKVFTDSARNTAKYYSGKTWNYEIDDRFSLNSNGLKAKGKCVVLGVSYDKHEDCEFYTIRDINSGETYTVNQFIIELKEA